MSKHTAESSAQTFSALEFQLEDKQAQVSAVNSESPGQIERGGARTARATKHLVSVSGML
jgi:hypothetical protein